MKITEIRGGGSFENNSSNTSRNLTLSAYGNNASVNLVGIVLKPMTVSGLFTNLTVSAFCNPEPLVLKK